jgi:hypothetical protein
VTAHVEIMEGVYILDTQDWFAPQNEWMDNFLGLSLKAWLELWWKLEVACDIIVKLMFIQSKIIVDPIYRGWVPVCTNNLQRASHLFDGYAIALKQDLDRNHHLSQVLWQ